MASSLEAPVVEVRYRISYCLCWLILLIVVTRNVSFAAESGSVPEHHLRLYHTHTGERIEHWLYRGIGGIPIFPKQKINLIISFAIIGQATSNTTIPKVFDILSDGGCGRRTSERGK